jgi:hypothetical protein
VKRVLAVLALVVLPMLVSTQPAHAVGYGACTIVGTMTFSPMTMSTGTMSTGTWTIGPATLDCQGVIGKRARITGRGPLTGSGTYTALAAGDGCLRQSGTGKVEYTIPTASGTIQVSEAETHTLAPVGMIDTPTLHGALEVLPPYDGDCVTKPVSRASFVAQVLLYRYPREYPPPLPFV